MVPTCPCCLCAYSAYVPMMLMWLWCLVYQKCLCVWVAHFYTAAIEIKIIWFEKTWENHSLFTITVQRGPINNSRIHDDVGKDDLNNRSINFGINFTCLHIFNVALELVLADTTLKILLQTSNKRLPLSLPCCSSSRRHVRLQYCSSFEWRPGWIQDLENGVVNGLEVKKNKCTRFSVGYVIFINKHTS